MKIVVQIYDKEAVVYEDDANPGAAFVRLDLSEEALILASAVKRVESEYGELPGLKDKAKEPAGIDSAVALRGYKPEIASFGTYEVKRYGNGTTLPHIVTIVGIEGVEYELKKVENK